MTAVGRPARPRLPKLRSLPPLTRREALWGYVFIAPWLIGFFLFTLAPMIASLAFTFSNIALDQQEPLAFVGLRNWQTLLGDGQAWESLAVTFRFALFQLPFIMVMPFLLAIGYVVFCVGNFIAVDLSQKQLIEFAAIVRPVAEKYHVVLNTLTPLPATSIAAFYWTVVVAVCFGILGITWRRQAKGSSTTS